ncbi:MAG: ABC transporter ATP-binding protein [Gemmatimonadota bacterium]|nr:ABC transporter ATP-binding protein [Gemmatimonadota bacterium]
MTAVIEAEALSKSFGKFLAVDQVSFAVDRGEIFGFLGPNGAGKTTTIKMLTGLLQPSSGRGRVAGLDLATAGVAIRHQLGYMSQRFSLYPDLTVAENISLFAGLYGVTGTRLAERRAWVLEMAGLTDKGNRLTAELSLGWKQRLALGCAVLHEPSVLFLDEPTSGVDPLSRRQFWALINQLSSGGTTVMVSTHFLEEAEYCHRVALMNRGRLIALDRPGALRAAMREPILTLASDNAPRAVAAVRGQAGILDVSLFGRAVHVVVREEAEGRRVIAAALAAAGLASGVPERVAASLEDVFVALVRREGGAVAG